MGKLNGNAISLDLTTNGKNIRLTSTNTIDGGCCLSAYEVNGYSFNELFKVNLKQELAKKLLGVSNGD